MTGGHPPKADDTDDTDDTAASDLFDRDAYLARIGAEEPPVLDADAVRLLHRAHLRNVPFENLDIHLGVPIALGATAIDKIVRRRRGGYCYELNGSFAALLTALGGHVDLLEARVYTPDGTVGIRYDHLCLAVVVAGGRVLADVGFGECFDEPLRWEPGVDQRDRNGSFRIEPGSPDDTTFDLVRDGRPVYRFDTTPLRLADFEPGNRFHQSPASHFSRNTVCSVATDDGRVTLRGTTLVETSAGERRERAIDPSELGTVLGERFGIELDDDAAAELASRTASPPGPPS